MLSRKQHNLIIFTLEPHPLQASLVNKLDAQYGQFNSHVFPDGESYLRLEQNVVGAECIVLADLSRPNNKYLPLIFLLDTLKELGAASVGLVAPYLSYMRQDRRFFDGEAITSRIFAHALSQHIDWLVTVDPHLHRYRALDEIYSAPNRVVQAAPALANWLKDQGNLLLVGPDAESEQWVANIAEISGHPFVIGNKQRFGDKEVAITLPKIDRTADMTAVIIDDVISSGETIKQCIVELEKQKIETIKCAAIHAIFADNSDLDLLDSSLISLSTCNTIAHATNNIDIGHLLVTPIMACVIENQWSKLRA